MDIDKSEKGAVLLVFVLVLIMSGTGIMLGQGLNTLGVCQSGNAGQGLRGCPTALMRGGASDAAQYLTAEQNIQRLNLAKEALLAAAVTYADNYGPRGAGPGHLPCPDLDPPDDGNAGNDGPDPPCGSTDKQIGRVPRLTLATRSDLTNTESTSSLIQSELNRSKLLEFYPQLSFQDRQPWYVVDDAFINNPTNRIVNAETTTTLSDSAGRAVVAVLIAPGKMMPESHQQRPGIAPADYVESVVTTLRAGPGRSATISRDHTVESNDQLIYIYRDELMPLVNRRVASYVAKLMLKKAAKQCPQAVDVDQETITITTDCLPSLLSVAVVDDERANTAQSSCQSAAVNIGATLVFGLENCSELLVEDGFIEDVNVDRHWLIRNQWPLHSALTVDADCLSLASVSCELMWKVNVAFEAGVANRAIGANGAIGAIGSNRANTEETTAGSSMPARVIQLHLKARSHES